MNADLTSNPLEATLRVRATLPGAALLMVGMSVLASTPCHAQVVVFETTAHARLVHTGNSLSLSGEPNANGPGVADSGHTLIALDPGAVDDSPANPGNPWFAGTTSSFALDGAAADLTLPPGSNVLHAELVWGGSYRYGVEDHSAVLDQPVTLTTPGGSFSVAPGLDTALTFDMMSTAGTVVRYYLRSADVTDRVASGGSGTYTVSGVPVTQGETVNTLNGGGWALVAVVEDGAEPCRSVSLGVGGEWVEDGQSLTVTFTNLATPPAGEVAGRALLAAFEGDASRTGDTAEILMPGTSTYLGLAGPNNPADNFFASQVNDAAGVLDSAGTFGLLNHDAATATNLAGGRQGFDLTAVLLDSAAGELANNQNSATLRLATTGDEYLLVLAAFEADSAGPCVAPPTAIFSDGFDTGDLAAWSVFVP